MSSENTGNPNSLIQSCNNIVIPYEDCTGTTHYVTPAVIAEVQRESANAPMPSAAHYGQQCLYLANPAWHRVQYNGLDQTTVSTTPTYPVPMYPPPPRFNLPMFHSQENLIPLSAPCETQSLSPANPTAPHVSHNDPQLQPKLTSTSFKQYPLHRFPSTYSLQYSQPSLHSPAHSYQKSYQNILPSIDMSVRNRASVVLQESSHKSDDLRAAMRNSNSSMFIPVRQDSSEALKEQNWSTKVRVQPNFTNPQGSSIQFPAPYGQQPLSLINPEWSSVPYNSPEQPSANSIRSPFSQDPFHGVPPKDVVVCSLPITHSLSTHISVENGTSNIDNELLHQSVGQGADVQNSNASKTNPGRRKFKKKKQSAPRALNKHTCPTEVLVIRLPEYYNSIEKVVNLFIKFGEVKMVILHKPNTKVPGQLWSYKNKVSDIGKSTCSLVQFQEHKDAINAVNIMKCLQNHAECVASENSAAVAESYSQDLDMANYIDAFDREGLLAMQEMRFALLRPGVEKDLSQREHVGYL